MKQAELEHLYRAHHMSLYRYLRAILRNPDDAMDCLQTVFAGLLRSSPDPQGEPRSYLFRAAHNAAIDLLRKRGRETSWSENGEHPLVVADDGADAEVVQKALAKLSVTHYEVVVLKIYSGLTFREIAAALEVPQKTCESRYAAALKRLARLLPHWGKRGA